MCCGLLGAGTGMGWELWVIMLLSVGDNVAGSTALTAVLVIGQLLPPSATRIQHPRTPASRWHKIHIK